MCNHDECVRGSFLAGRAVMGREAGRRSMDTMHLTGATEKASGLDLERAAMGAIDVDAKVTIYVVLACTIAASGGLLFGVLSLAFEIRRVLKFLRSLYQSSRCVHVLAGRCLPPHVGPHFPSSNSS